jgi:predicted DNA-binding transcriptional regulator AlpA
MRTTALKNEKMLLEEAAPRQSGARNVTHPKHWEPNREFRVISSQLQESNGLQDSETSLRSPPQTDRLLNAREVAAKLGVSERWVRDHTTRRFPKIRGVKLGTLIRYRRIDVEFFMKELETLSSSRRPPFGV